MLKSFKMMDPKDELQADHLQGTGIIGILQKRFRVIPRLCFVRFQTFLEVYFWSEPS